MIPFRHRAFLFVVATLFLVGSSAAQEAEFDSYFALSVEAYQAGDIEKAHRLTKLAVEAGQRAWGEQGFHVLRAKNNLGWLSIQLGKLEEAKAVYTETYRALANFRTTDERDQAIKAAQGLGICLVDLNQDEKALPILKWALAIEDQKERNSTVASDLLNAISIGQDKLKQYSEAEETCRRCLEIRSSGFAANNPLVSTVASRLAQVLAKQRKFAESEKRITENISVAENSTPPDRARAASEFFQLSEVLLTQRRFADAEKAAQRSFDLYVFLGRDYDARATSALDRLANIAGDDKQWELSLERRRRALEQVEGRVGNEHLDLTYYLEQIGWGELQRKGYSEAETALRRSLDIREKLQANDSKAHVYGMNLLASALAKQGKMEEAERLFQEAISIRKSEGNEGRLASAVTALANFYIAQKQPERAEQLFSDTLAEREKGLGSDNAALSVFVMSMADCYTSLGKYDQAETLLKRAIAIREKSLGPEHVDVAESLSKLGDFYERLGRYVEAEAIYSRSLAIREKALAPGDMLIADSLKELAWDHHRLFQDKIGMPLIDRAIRIYQDQRRIHESAFAWVLNTKAALSGHLEDHVAAIENYEKAIELLKRDRERYGIILNNIANSYVALGRYAEAETAYRQSRAEALQDVQEAKESVTETIHSYGRLVLTTGNLARHLQTIGKREEALQLLEEALPIAEQNLSPDHPFLEDVLTCLANHYQGDLQLERAEALREQSLKIMEKVFGNAHVSYGWSLCALGELRKRQGRIDDAEAFFHQAKPILLKGDDHNDDQSYMREAEAELDILRGKLADAKDDLKEALSLREKKLGNSHPRLIGVLLSLTDIAILQGDLSYAEETLNRCRAITTTVFGEESIQMASVLERQMKIARFQGKLDESLELSRREVELTIRTYGEMHPQTDLARVRQADILLEAGKITEAEELARRALTVLAERLPAKHHLLADAELVVGKALLAGSKLDGAKEAVERAVTLRTAVFGADNYHIAEAGAVLGRIEVAAKDHSALSSLSRAYEVQLKSLGVGSSQTLQTMVDLGEVLLAENKLNQSQQFCASALPKLKSSMGRDHALSRRAARCLATAYRADQKEQLALQLEREFMLTMAP